MPDPYRCWTARDLQTALALDARGVPSADIARRLGRTTAAVTERLRKARGPTRPYRTLASLAPRIRRLVSWGLCFRAVCRRLGLHSAVLHRHLDALGLEVRPSAAESARVARARLRGAKKGGESSQRRTRLAALSLGWAGWTLSQARALDALHRGGPASARALSALVPYGRARLKQVLWGLRRAGAVTLEGRSVYRLADGVGPLGLPGELRGTRRAV